MSDQQTFKALVVRETNDGEFEKSIQERSVSDLPENDLLIEVHYSSLNYKDAMSAAGNKMITKNYPHTPGIDAAGIVVSDKSGTFRKVKRSWYLVMISVWIPLAVWVR